MASPGVFLDPALLVWDSIEFDGNSHQYWELIGEISDIIRSLEKINPVFLMTQELLGILISEFPANVVAKQGWDLGPFLNVLYSFLSKVTPLPAVDVAQVEDLQPDVRDRAHFKKSLKVEIGLSLSCNGLGARDRVVASSTSQWRFGECELNYRILGNLVQLPALLSSEDYSAFERRDDRVFERNPKHESPKGWGTHLPIMTDDRLQFLLDNAKYRNDLGDCLCVFCTENEKYFIFRLHNPKRFHAYPVEENELEGIGFSKLDIPIL